MIKYLLKGWWAMFGRGIKIFSMFGFEVKVDWSWLVILALVVWSLAAGIFPAQFPGLTSGSYILMGIAGALGLFGSIVLHELTHSLVARRFGLPIKGITLFIFGGVAEMTDEPPNAQAEFFMAAAGPISSFVIGGVFLGITYAGINYGLYPPVLGVLRWIGLINLILAVFNLVPGFPLDGGRVLRSILWGMRGNLRWATRVAAQVGSAFGFLLIGLGIITILLYGNPIGGLWWILIGMFLNSAAKQSYQQVLVRESLKGEPVSRFMSPDAVTVSPSTDIGRLVTDYIYRFHYSMFPVVEGDRLVGCVSTRQVREIPQEEWGRHTVGEVATSCSPDTVVRSDEDAVKALAIMSRTNGAPLMVVDDGHLKGVVSLKDLLRFLSLKLELQPGGRDAARGITG